MSVLYPRSMRDLAHLETKGPTMKKTPVLKRTKFRSGFENKDATIFLCIDGIRDLYHLPTTAEKIELQFHRSPGRNRHEFYLVRDKIGCLDGIVDGGHVGLGRPTLDFFYELLNTPYAPFGTTWYVEIHYE